FGRQRDLACLLTADQIAAYRDERLTTLWPQDSGDVGGTGSPVETSENRLLDLERVHQRDEVNAQSGRLTVAQRRGGEEARASVSAEIRDDDAIAFRGEERRDVGVALDVVGPAVKEHHSAARGWAGIDVADVQHTSVDLLDRSQRRISAESVL